MSTLPKLPKGTRDFPPAVMVRRNFIIGHIRDVFRSFGFQPLETPAMENLSVLMGKYGEEGDRLLYKILNSGNFAESLTPESLNSPEELLPQIAEKGLRYDLTVPFARFVAANRNDLAFPFKRYQIQPVWRADRPQKGRYREFYQCDADVVGTSSLICELEIIQMIGQVFSRLGITDYDIKINHREIIRGIAQYAGQDGRETDLAVAIDKIDKIGWQGVTEELRGKGFDENAIEKIHTVISLSGSFREKLTALATLSDNGSLLKGSEDLLEIDRLLEKSGTDKKMVSLDLSLARGLSYYTGAIFEVKINNVQMGSVSGGGRYDNLTGVFGVPDIPGVGFSFGIDRIYDCMADLGLFPESELDNTKALIVHFDQTNLDYGLRLVTRLRNEGISSEVYPEISKLKKQLQYADRKSIPFVVFIGSDEMNSGIFTVKDLRNGNEAKVPADQLSSYLSN